jgi:hypothetical protein
MICYHFSSQYYPVSCWVGGKFACSGNGCSLPDLLVTVDTDTQWVKI